MVEDQFLPFVRETFGVGGPVRIQRLLTLGHGESSLADRLASLPPPPGLALGFRPTVPYVEIKLIARGDAGLAALPAYHESLRQTLGDAVVAENNNSIASAVHNLLENQGLTLSIAESLTGGMLASMLVDYPGSSSYLQQALVTYSVDAKRDLLGVPAAVLERYGAVSMETAHAMAGGARRYQDCDFALATTGVAGPQGSSEIRPVGTVCIALADRERTWVQCVHLNQRSRGLVRQMSCAIALDMLRRRVLEHEPVVAYPFITRSDLRVFTD